ncbi:MAG: hypothetical protein LBM00_02800 [Deltaproteobacteria bacterium]|jgi:hypothetical protein|nr:hypothetical protein [Deltaproteobacteria bacterium]
MKMNARLFCVALVLVLAACGADPADEMLDDEAKIIARCETFARQDSISLDEYRKLTGLFKDFGVKYQQAGAMRFNAEQSRRAAGQARQFMDAYRRILQKVRP